MNRDITHIHHLIQGYWDAALSESQERELLHLLADPDTPETSQVAEARAVTGIQAAARMRHRDLRRTSVLRLCIRAACVAGVCIALTGVAIHFNSSEETGTYAYVNGERITDPDRVLAMMENDLALIGNAGGEAEAAVSNSLAIMGMVLNEYATESPNDSTPH